MRDPGVMRLGAKVPRVLALSISFVLVLAACGGENGEGETTPPSEPATGDEGPVLPEGVDGPEDLRAAFFIAGADNTYVQANIRAAEETAERLGVGSIQVFDGKWDATEEFNQMQNALTTGDFNAWIVEAVDPQQVCDIVNTAMGQGILVIVANQGLCGNDTWTPGTISFVGGQTDDVYMTWLTHIQETNPEGGKVAILTGPDLNYNTNNMLEAVEQTLEADSTFNIVSNQQIDYTTPTAFQTAQDILQANPDLDIFISNYSEMTNGIVEAVSDAGLSDQVKVYDMGGNEWAVQAVSQGDIESTLPFLPYTELEATIEALVDYVEGDEVSQYINLTELLTFEGSPFVTPGNVSEFEAQY